jgi:FkbM family methyltransferase
VLGPADRTRLIEHLAAEPVFIPLRWGGAQLQLPYTGVNPVIEREQLRGVFFEHQELVFLADRLPGGLRILDVGANTGNHTLFFATVMQAEIVIAIEPDSRACAALRSMVAANRLNNVDLSCLGYAAGRMCSTARPIPSVTAGLGAVHLEPAQDGPISVLPLDKLVDAPIDFIKIDVEGMEMEVLAGARSLIARFRPALYIEVLDGAILAFMQWVDENGYRIEKLFPDKTHCNCFLVPAERS